MPPAGHDLLQSANDTYAFIDSNEHHRVGCTNVLGQ
jgi:hypothetical protein